MRSKFVTVLIVLSVAFVGVFGFFAASLMDHTNMSSCFLPMGTSDCPMEMSVFSMIDHHVGGLQALSNAPLSSLFGFILLILALAAPLFFIFLKLFPNNNFAKQLVALWRFRLRQRQPTAPLKEILRWMAIHYKRDPHASSRVYGLTRYLLSAESVFV